MRSSPATAEGPRKITQPIACARGLVGLALVELPDPDDQDFEVDDGYDSGIDERSGACPRLLVSTRWWVISYRFGLHESQSSLPIAASISSSIDCSDGFGSGVNVPYSCNAHCHQPLI